MRKKYLYLYLLLFSILFLSFIPISPKASEDDLISREDVFKFLQSAHKTQVSLSEKDRSKDEIRSIMDPYFTKEYQQKFYKANLFEENGKYFTYGSDFGDLYIPFFQFSDKTKVVFDGNQIYVFEYFSASREGPVTYDNHYEGILIKKLNNQWKISNFLINIPERIIEKSNKP